MVIRYISVYRVNVSGYIVVVIGLTLMFIVYISGNGIIYYISVMGYWSTTLFSPVLIFSIVLQAAQ